MSNKQTGFTLIELIIVVVILGLLAVTALPKFLNIRDQAESATIEGVAGGMAAAVGLVRGQWEINARPDIDPVLFEYDTTEVGVDGDIGYPTTGPGAASTLVSAMTAQKCKDVMDTILQSAPSSVTTGVTTTDVIEDNNYYVASFSDDPDAGGTGNDSCIYYLVESIDLTDLPVNDENKLATRGFKYFPSNGQVLVFEL